ncbi:hypothetical protein C0J52_05486 [Blattella germanica]|nr:hypothetical protein C0J52_05486 [Blattella germanica]
MYCILRHPSFASGKGPGLEVADSSQAGFGDIPARVVCYAREEFINLQLDRNVCFIDIVYQVRAINGSQ